MLTHVNSSVAVGLDGMLVDVEVDVSGRGFPGLTIVGLAGKAIDEAKDRVRTAITNAGFEMPDSRITVNLAPADIPKTGSGFDLPIAIGILASSGFITKESLEHSLFIGELSLEGNLRRVPGLIAFAMLAKKQGIATMYVPAVNASEAALVEGVTVIPVSSLNDLILHLNNTQLILPQQPVEMVSRSQITSPFDFTDVKGQEIAKRAFEIAAAGYHNIHLKGPPGVGKTMLSRAFPSILPSLEHEDILDVTRIYSIAGLLHTQTLITRPPYRSPHHTTSKVGLIGGGTNPTPGEISLSHHGVLFLDEFPEFPLSVLESLRQPLEDGEVTIARAAGSITFPCRFILIAASNPCPCGYLGHPQKPCKCMPVSVMKYRKKLSGPLIDRIDLHIDILPVSEESLTNNNIVPETSSVVRERVMRAREIQKKRLNGEFISCNGMMNSRHVRTYCQLTEQANVILKQALSKLSLSARSYFKIIKVAQTIADLAGAEKIEAQFIAEALQYRLV
jgi:magnesium chelatase family protein